MQATPDRAPIVSWISSAPTAVHLPECCGCYRWFCTLKPPCRKAQLPLVLGGVEFIVKAELRERPPRPAAVVRWWFESVLLALYGQVRRSLAMQPHHGALGPPPLAQPDAAAGSGDRYAHAACGCPLPV